MKNSRLLPITCSAVALLAGPFAFSDELLEEIVVTATKRASDLQSVPIAVSAITDAALRSSGVEDIRDIQRLDPNLNFVASQSNLNTTSIRIRGVGTTGNNTGFESSVGVFIDGVYQSRPGVALSEFVDIEQVEILRGPQGTLFGRNTSAGAINIKTKLAAIDDDSAFVSVSYGDYNLKNVQAGFNVPINEVSAVRFAGSIRERDGTVEAEVPTAEDHNTTDRYILRGSYVWEPTLDSQLEIRTDFSHTDSICCAPVILTDYQPINPAVNLDAFFGADIVDPDKRTAPGENSFERSSQSGISLTYSKELDAAGLTYVASYRDVDTDNWGDSDFTNRSLVITPEDNPNNIHSTTETHEFRVNGEAFDGGLDWLIGAYYLKESIAEEVNRAAGTDNDIQVAVLNGGPLAAPITGSFASNLFFQETEGYALFTHNIIRFAEDWSLTLGLRYADERKHGGMTPIDNADNGACGAALAAIGGAPSNGAEELIFVLGCTPIYGPVTGNPLTAPYTASFDDDAFTYNASLDYQGIEDTLLYASVSSGFKSGGINLDITGSGVSNPTFDSETIEAQEIGIKTKLFDGAVAVNAALYHMDIEDLQILRFVNAAFQVFEVPEAGSQGLELDVDWFVDENLNLSLGYALVDTETDLQANASGDCIEFKVDSSGSSCGTSVLPNAPEHRVVLAANYSLPLGGGWEWSFAPIVRWESSSRPDPANLSTKQGDNTIVDLQAGFEKFENGFDVDFWVKNVTDEVVNTRTFSTISATFAAGTSQSTWLNEPRTMGMTITQNF